MRPPSGRESLKLKNVIMITTDQQKADAMGCMDPSYLTPNLDRLAQRSVRFSGAVTTSAQCSPSRASWITGKYPHQVGVYQIGHVLDPREWGVARAFSQAGYETAYFGKWHLGGSPRDHGFEVTEYRRDGADPGGANPDPRFHSHKDAATTAQTLHYLEDWDGTKPFFLNVHYYMPHPNAPEDYPFERIEGLAELFPLEDMPVPDSYYRDDLSTKPAFQLERSQTGESALTEALVRRDARHYRSMLALVDRYVGKLLDKLESKGLWENTVILFTSDHGDMQGAHRLRLKGVLPYKELYRVPLLLYVPGVDFPRRVVDDPVSTAAIPGTLLAAAGLPVPEECEGGSLLPIAKREETDEERHVFFEHYAAYWGHHPFAGVETRRWKYVHYVQERQEEMYDMEADPDELVNIAGLPESAQVKAGLRELVDAWWNATGALSRPAIQDPESRWGVRKGNRG